MQPVPRAALLGARCSFEGLWRCGRDAGAAVYEVLLSK
jgi:hypothetical protein